MRVLDDCFGRKVRLTEERLTHILERPEMKGLADEVERVLRQRFSCGVRARMMPCDCSTSFTRKRLWVADGSVLWLSFGG